MARREDNKNNFKKILKGALGVGAAYLAVKDPDGFLQVRGDLAKDAVKEKEALIAARGEELAADKAYYRQRADIAYANKTAQYETDFAATNKLDKALSSLVSASASNGASKRDIAMNVLVAKGIIPNTGTKIDDTSGIAEQLNTEINKLKDVVGEDGKVTGYTYEGTAVPNRPDYKDYFDSSKIQLAQASIADNSFSTLSQKLFGKDDTGDAALATLQRDMDSGYQEVLESNLSGKSKEYQFKAGEEKETDKDKTLLGIPVINKNSGEVINISQSPIFNLIYQDDKNLDAETLVLKNSQTAIFKQIKTAYESQSDDASTPFAGNVFSVIQASVPDASLNALAEYDGSRIVGTSAEGAFLYNRVQSLKYEIAEANYHKAGWQTGNPADNQSNSLETRLALEVPKRILNLDAGGFKGIEGVYVIPTSVVALYEIDNIPSTVIDSETPDVSVETKQYLTEELNKILEVNKGKTMSALAPLLDAKVAEILKPQQAEEIKNSIPRISEDGNSFIINGRKLDFSKLDELIKNGTIKEEDNKFVAINEKGEKEVTPESVIEAYNVWLGTQKTSVDEQVEELVPNISKMQLGTVIEKDLLTAEYLNSYTKDVSFSGKEEFYAGNNMMLNIGDEVTTKDGIKYESYVDTTTDNQGREISTLKFKPITIE